MKTYLVGGAVRDELMGLPAGDRDWVVVGATPEQMRAQGYRQVGREFPVFLHPVTGEEYALARTERKAGKGHLGFVVHAAPTVTLEEDLARRDLTINAIARDADGRLIDPFGGLADLEMRVLRHVTAAFREDPLRVLRLARFAARFPHFTVANETLALCRCMVEGDELETLTPERIWQEISRGLGTGKPSRMFEVLREMGALERIAPEIDRLWRTSSRGQTVSGGDVASLAMHAIDYAAERNWPIDTRFAALTHALDQGEAPAPPQSEQNGHGTTRAFAVDCLAARWRMPRHIHELARLMVAEHEHIDRLAALSSAAIHDLLMRCDALRRPDRFARMLDACEAVHASRLHHAGRTSEATRWPARHDAERALAAMRGVDAAAIARTVGEAKSRHATKPADVGLASFIVPRQETREMVESASHRIAAALRQARIEAIDAARQSSGR